MRKFQNELGKRRRRRRRNERIVCWIGEMKNAAREENETN